MTYYTYISVYIYLTLPFRRFFGQRPAAPDLKEPPTADSDWRPGPSVRVTSRPGPGSVRVMRVQAELGPSRDQAVPSVTACSKGAAAPRSMHAAPEAQRRGARPRGHRLVVAALLA